MSILSWQSLVFLIPLITGFAFLLGGALGISEPAFGDVDVGADADADADGDAETEHDASADTPSLLELCGVGRVPLSLVLTTWLFAFGGIGLSLSRLLVPLWGPTLSALVSAGLAFGIAPLIVAVMARSVSRFAPTLETYADPIDELVGSVGVAELQIGHEFGVASVVDRGGAQIKIRCRSETGPIDKGERVLLMEYDALHSVFVVEKSPV